MKELDKICGKLIIFVKGRDKGWETEKIKILFTWWWNVLYTKKC